jgi:hypothetical protein
MRTQLTTGCLAVLWLAFAASAFANSIHAPVAQLERLDKANAEAATAVAADYSWTRMMPFGSEDDENDDGSLNGSDAAALEILRQQVTNLGGKVFLVSGNAFGVQGARGVFVLGSIRGLGSPAGGGAGDGIGSGAVPEPASWMLSAAGLLFLIRAYYSKNRSSISPK